jgi:signal peptidase II
VNHPSPINEATPDLRPNRVPGSPRVRLATTALVAVVVIVVDALSKDWVLRSIAPSDRKHLIGTFSLVRRFNTGAAFSFGDGRRATAWVVTFVVCVVVVGVTRHLLRPPENSPVTRDRRWWWVLGLIVGGAVGNQLDRLFRGDGWNRGAVVDFIDPGFFPIFNVADSALTVGCIVAALLSLLVAPSNEERAPSAGGQTAPDGPTPTQLSVATSVTPFEEPTR